MKRTPLEELIIEKTDRRARYKKRMRDGGNSRVEVWFPSAYAADLRELAGLMVALGDDGGEIGAELRQLVAKAAARKSGAEQIAGGQDDGPHT